MGRLPPEQQIRMSNAGERIILLIVGRVMALSPKKKRLTRPPLPVLPLTAIIMIDHHNDCETQSLGEIAFLKSQFRVEGTRFCGRLGRLICHFWQASGW
jgi:hypothetical protein